MGIEQFTSIIIMVAAGCIFAFTGIYTIRKREAPGGLYFTLLMFSTGWWTLTGAGEFLASSIETKLLFAKLSYLGVLTLPSLWMLFAIHYTRLTSVLIGRRGLLLIIVPVLIMGAILSNDLHHQFWTSITPLYDSATAPLVYSHGIIFWIHTAYAYSLILIGTIF